MCGYSPRSTESALDTLQVAIKYQCLDLVEHIVRYLAQHLNPDNVLQIMYWGHQYTCNNSSSTVPSAPPADSAEEDLPPPYPGTEPSYEGTAPPPPYEAIYDIDLNSSCRQLVDGCLKLLDEKADLVLTSEALEEVSTPLLSAVLSRDTLAVSSEVVVLDALFRWSSAECRRQQQQLNVRNRRLVLQQMLLLPRLLALQPHQLSALNELYDSREREYISSVVRNEIPNVTVPPMFAGFIPQLSRPRKPVLHSETTVPDQTKPANKKKERCSKTELLLDILTSFCRLLD